MFNYFKVSFFVGALFAASSVGAADIECDGCSYSQMEARAIAQGKGYHRVYDYSFGSIHEFSVVCEGNIVQGGSVGTVDKKHAMQGHSFMDAQGGGASTQGSGGCAFNRPLRVEEVPLDGAMAQAWPTILEFMSVHRSNRGSDHDFFIDSRQPGTGFPHDSSVYKPIGDYAARVAMTDGMAASVDAISNFRAAALAAIRSHFTGVPLQYLIKFVFKDGSSVLIKLDGATDQFSFVPGTARHANGEPLVEGSSVGYVGNYDMTGVDQQAYLNFLGSMGVTIINGGGGGTMSCTWDGQKLTCRISMMAN